MIFKKFIYLVPLLVLILTLNSCNGDVFVPDTRPAVSQITLSGDGDSTVIAYEPRGLEHINLYHLFSFPIEAYDKNGQRVEGNTKPSEFGRVVLKSTNIDMEFESVPGGIKVKVNENLYVGGVSMFLELDYGYVCHSIEIDVTLSSPYDIVDVEYDMTAMNVFGPWTEGYTSSFTTTNDTDQDIRVTDLPLENESSKFCFDFEVPVRILTSVDDHPLDIPIPTFQNKEAGLYGRTVRYDFSVTGNVDFEPTIDKSVRVSLLVPAKSKRRYFLYIEHMQLEVPVRLKIKHPVSGRQRDLTGKLTVTEPSRFFYGYQDVTDNE